MLSLSLALSLYLPYASTVLKKLQNCAKNKKCATEEASVTHNRNDDDDDPVALSLFFIYDAFVVHH
jgi:hypothetical protein